MTIKHCCRCSTWLQTAQVEALVQGSLSQLGKYDVSLGRGHVALPLVRCVGRVPRGTGGRCLCGFRLQNDLGKKSYQKLLLSG